MVYVRRELPNCQSCFRKLMNLPVEFCGNLRVEQRTESREFLLALCLRNLERMTYPHGAFLNIHRNVHTCLTFSFVGACRRRVSICMHGGQ